MNQQLRKNARGFTIIEVMIVLAIAGLILLIVFLAVPALQRNSRNTQRKNDVSTILGSVNEYTSNNNGTLPTTCAQSTQGANLGYYTGGCAAGAGAVTQVAGAQGALANTAANDRLVVVTSATCGAGGAALAGSARQVAVQYLTEISGGWTATCQQS